MPKKIKRFIDKKNSVTFRLVHRSQQDPLVADERAPQHVLVEQNKRQREDERHTSQSVDTEAREKAKKKQRKYGIYHDDDYDYLKHLKDVSRPEPISGFEVSARPKGQLEAEGSKMNLPSSVFESFVEEKVGLLNKAVPVTGPQPQWDPDIVESLFDEHYHDPDNELDDDFVIQANGNARLSEGDEDEESGNQPNDQEDDSGDDTLGSLNGSQHSFDEEETKSRFTNYSMSSSVIRRGDGLRLLDDRFERTYGAYVDEQIGALDCDNIEGYLQPGDVLLEHVINDYKKDQVKVELGDLRKFGPNHQIDENSDDEEDLVKMVIEEPTEKWDCESFLTTYSTLYNHPKMISVPSKPRPIKVSSKTGLPCDVLNGQGLTAAALKSLDSEVTPSSSKSVISVCSLMRAKNETVDEKRARKQMVKEHRKERRIEKKANSLAFKEEKKKQAVLLNNVKEQLKGIKF